MIYKRYKDLTRELINTKLDLKYMIIRRDRLIERSGPQNVQAIQYDYIGSGEKAEDVVQLYKDIAECISSIARLEVIIHDLECLKDEYERTIKKYAEKFNDVEAKIFYLKHVQNKSLLEIAGELHYDYGTIKNYHYKMMRNLREDYERSDQKVTF